MMKILCLLLLLANVFVALWEYRYDIDYGDHSTELPQTTIGPGQERILLISEANTPATTAATPIIAAPQTNTLPALKNENNPSAPSQPKELTRDIQEGLNPSVPDNAKTNDIKADNVLP